MAADPLQTPLQFLKGVGPRKAADLEKAGLRTVEDLLVRFPRRYEDRSRFQPIATLRAGGTAAVCGAIISCGVASTRRPGFALFTALVQDDSGQVKAVWPNQAFLKDVLKPHQRIVLFGRTEYWGSRGLQITAPEFEVLQDDGESEPLHTGRIVPIYEKTGVVTPNMHRTLVHRALELLTEPLADVVPPDLAARHGWPDRRTAFRQAHFPDAGTSIEALNAAATPAQRRIIFEDFFVYQTGLALRRRDNAQVRKPHVVRVDDALRQRVREVLPFKLTAGQREAVREVVADMQRPWPMQRLLQGDVGSGKTVVAFLAAMVAMENGCQVALMAPTEILAEQHLHTFQQWLFGTRFRVGLLVGTKSDAARRRLVEEIAAGDVSLVIGTHALVQESVRFRALALAIVDEQHRFGVVQRGLLGEKGLHPDVLLMTATPIPRTLALTACGDMDVSIMRDRPPGRQPVQTVIRPETRRDEVYRLMRAAVAAGRQAYVVYPIIESSEKTDLKAATTMARHMAGAVFPDLRVALLHGRLKADEKEDVMRRFSAGAIDILVSTTVIEVGVDVPNATVMVVEHAERFGLAQLHQLRGRIGRGAHASTCVLLYDAPWSEESRARLTAVADSEDGFALAERDLELRGPGDVFGTRQSGVPWLRAGDPVRDADLLALAHEEARRLVDGGTVPPALADHLRRVWQQQFGLVTVG
ncbi:MAG: ATP-dependent DNA helicase RecG [Vicinamibacterales bacterium]